MIETTSGISARDRALAALQAKLDENHVREEETRRNIERQNLRLFHEWLKARLGIEAWPESLVYELDESGVALTMKGPDLCYVVQCDGCREPLPSWRVYDWETLGQAIKADEAGELAETCQDCRERQWQERKQAREDDGPPIPVSLTPQERLFAALRDWLAAEGYVQR
jgi:hypothetical protein